MRAIALTACLLLFHLASAFGASGGRGRIGTQFWKYSAESLILGVPAVADNGFVYFTSYPFTLHALHPSGGLRWIETHAGYTSPTIGHRAVYVAGGPWSMDGSIRGSISAYSFQGRPRWTVLTANSITTSASLSREDTLYVGSNEGALLAVSRDGTFQWVAGGGDWILREAAVGWNGTVYYSSGADIPLAFAVNPLGETIWEAPARAEVPSPFALGDDGALYFGVDHELRALNPDGSLRWAFPLEGFRQSSAVIAGDGTIYIVSQARTLYAFTSAGVEKWEFNYTESGPGGESLPLTAPAVDRDGVIYLGAGAHLLALNPDAAIAWSFPVPGGLTSPPILSRFGIIYFADARNNVHAVFGSAPPAPNGWPMFRHDAKGTSNIGHARLPLLRPWGQ
jgi:outer membrane protein assembly factor BamB